MCLKKRQGNLKLSELDVVKIKKELYATKTNPIGVQSALAKKYDVSQTLLRLIKTGKAWKHVLPELNIKAQAQFRYGKNNHKTKLNEMVVKNIREIHKNKEMTYSQLARKYNVSHPTIRAIVLNKSWKDI